MQRALHGPEVVDVMRCREPNLLPWLPAQGRVALPERCLAVIVPCYNEAHTVGQGVERLLGLPCVAEVVVVDDGSSDHSCEMLPVCARGSVRLEVIRLGRNQGKGAAIRQGLSHVTSSMVVIQDADLEYDPFQLPALFWPVREGCAVVVYGSRFAPGSYADTPWWHKWMNRMLTTCANQILGLHLTDEATCYKLMPTSLLRFLDLREKGFGFCAEVTAKLAALQAPILEVPIRYTARARRQGKKIRMRDGWEAVACFLRYRHWRPGIRVPCPPAREGPGQPASHDATEPRQPQ